MAPRRWERPGPVINTDESDPVQMRRSYKFLMRPTRRQSALLSECLEDMRQLYNAALEERREAWRMGKHRVTFYSQDAQLKEIRAADADMRRWSSQAQKATLHRLDRAYQNFFRRVKASEKPGHPRFKGRGWFDSVEWPLNGNGCKWNSQMDRLATRVYLLGIGHIRVHQHRAIGGTVKTITAKREGNRWYVIVSCDDVPAEPLPITGAAVGIDLGVANFLTTSDGTHVPNPRYLAAAAERLTASQQDLQRKKRGSKRRRKAVAKVVAQHGKVRRSRLDHAHKTALALVRDHDLIAHEALNVANMTRRPRPKLAEDGAYGPNGAAAKSGLNRSINDAGWGVFLRILADKAESAGRQVIAVNPRYTSQRCSQCGHVDAGNRASQAEFRCQACGHEAHADINAAINILRSGLDLQVLAA
jgi:putative transposase